MKRKLSPAEQRELIGELCVAITNISAIDDAVQFIVDLLSKQEITMLAKRLKIAKLLLDGKKYLEIKNQLRVGVGTVAKIRAWLDEGGNGFRMVYKKTKGVKNPLAQIFHDDLEAGGRKRARVLYNWPGLLIEEIARSANQRQRRRLLKILEDIPKKQKIHRDLITLFS